MVNNSTLNFILSLTDKLSSPLQKVSTKFSEFSEKSKKTFKQLEEQTTNNAKTMAAGWATAWGAIQGFKGGLQPAIDMNRALNDVKSFGVSETALKKLNNTALNFTATYGESAVGFVKSSETISQAIKGLTDSQLITFTNATNLLGVDSKKGADAAAQYMSTVYGGFQSQIEAMGKSNWAKSFSSQTAEATRLYRTNIDNLNAAFKESGALAGQYGLDLTEQLAVIGTLGSTMDGGKAGGALKSFLENAGSAGQKLGLTFTDSTGKLLPMVDIIDKLNNKFGDLSLDKNAQALRGAFGGGAQAVMDLMKNTDQLKNGIVKLGNIHGLEHLEKLAQQNVDPWKQFNGQIEAVRTSFGQALLPVLNPVFEKLSTIGKTLQRWTVLFPNLTKLVGLFAVGMLTVSLITGSLTLGMGLFKNTLLALQLAWKAVTLATWLFNAALWANPITWIVAAIVALIAIIGVCIYYWDDITAAIGNFASFIMNGFSSAIDWVLAKFDLLTDWFTSMGSWTGLIKQIWLGFLKIIAGAIDKIIEYINYIPGVDIKFRASDHMPDFSDIEEPTLKLKAASQQVIEAQQVKGAQGGQGIINNFVQTQAAQANNSATGKIFNIENLTIQNDKPMTPGELQGMILMQGGGL